MSRLIDADELLYVLCTSSYPQDVDTGKAYYIFKKELRNAPTVNAVQVVRCKDCKYAHLTYDKEAKYCDQWETGEALYLDGDFYCAFGEKKVTE